jgi:hypothetical protein
MALTQIDEIRVWNGVVPFDAADRYPEADLRARWRSAIGPVQLVLHDHIVAVEQNRRIDSLIGIALVRVNEEYVLTPGAEVATTLVTDDDVRSKLRGRDWLAVRLARANIVTSMSRLKCYCE